MHLDGFASVAVMYKLKKDGLPTYTVVPPPYSKKKINITRTDETQIVKFKKNNGNRHILVVAFVFFLLVFVGAAAYAARSRRRHR